MVQTSCGRVSPQIISLDNVEKQYSNVGYKKETIFSSLIGICEMVGTENVRSVTKSLL